MNMRQLLLMGRPIKRAGSSPPSAPTGLAATGGTGQIVLTYSASGATSCNILISSDGGATYPQTITGQSTTTYTDASATSNAQVSSGQVYYKIQAVNGGGTSAASSAVNASPWIADDTFTDANGTALTSHTMNVGSGWTYGSGTADIQGNAAHVLTFASSQFVAFTDVGTPTVSATVTVNLTTSGAAAVVIRYQDSTNFWVAYVQDGQTNGLRLFSCIGGSFTQRANIPFTVTHGVPYTFTLAGDQSTLTISYPALSQTASFTSTALQAATKVGLFSNGAVGCTFDNFTVTTSPKLTLIGTEYFNGGAVLNSGNLGSLFTSIPTGSLTPQPRGPRSAAIASPGFCGNPSNANVDAHYLLNVALGFNAGTGGGLLLGWFFLPAPLTDGTATHGPRLLGINSTQNGVGQFSIIQNGNTGNLDVVQNSSGGNASIPYMSNTWVELAIAWYAITGVSQTYQAFYRQGPGGTWTAIAAPWATSVWAIQYAYLNNFANLTMNLRVGSVRLYSASSMPTVTDVQGIIDIIDPPAASNGAATPATFTINPATGNDSNNGISAPVKTLTGLTSINLLPQPTGSAIGSGDTLIIDTSGAPLKTNGSQLLFSYLGMNVIPQTGQTYAVIDPTYTFVPADWTLDTGNIYVTTHVSGADDYLWVNSVGMSRQVGTPTGAGQFQNVDATHMKVWFPANATPATAGTIQRSYSINGSYQPAVGWNADAISMQGLYVDGTVQNDNANYCLGDEPGAGSASITGCALGLVLGGDKHCLGQTEAATGSTLTVTNCQIGPCINSGTPIVNYTGLSSQTGMNAVWNKIACTGTNLLGGSNLFSNSLWTGHGSSSFDTVTFSAVYMLYSRTPLYNWAGISDQGNETTLVLSNGTTVFTLSSNTQINVSQSSILVSSPSTTSVGANITDSVIVDIQPSGSLLTLTGAVVFEGVTFDLRGRNNNNGVYDCSGIASLTLRGCVIIAPATGTMKALFSGIPGGATLVMDYNEYVNVSATDTLCALFQTLGNKTIAQMRGLGYETNSKFQGVDVGFTLAVNLSGANIYKRTASATAQRSRGDGYDRGGVTTIWNGSAFAPNTPTLYSPRNDAGAYQFV